MFGKLFNPDNALMITMTQVTDSIFLSLFWLLGCLPVVTAGAATAALYDAVYHGFRKGDKHSWQRFLHAFRQNLKTSIVPTLVLLAAATLTGKGLIGAWNAAVAGELSWMLFAGLAFVGVLVAGVFSVLFPLLSRFETGAAQLMKNTVLLGMANLPRTIGLGFVNVVCVFLCAWFVVPLFFLPAVTALISTLFLEPMFRPYMHEDAAA